MTISLDDAVCYDIETTLVAFTMNVQGLYSDLDITFEISIYRDDRVALLAWFDYWKQRRTLMIGFNTIEFDYPVIHFIYTNPDCTVHEIYEFAQERINDHTHFGVIWESDRFAPQLDVYKMMHFDNKAKRTSLKALQFAMRSENVQEMPLPFDEPMSSDQVLDVLIPYNKHDVAETKKFTLYNIKHIQFRTELIETGLVKGDVLNMNDTKIGAKYVEQRLGDDLCYERRNGRKMPRQTIRERVAFDDIIFPYVEFKNPEFARVLTWMRGQVLSVDEITERLKTKGVFAGVHATVGGVDFHFGTGGVHASVAAQRFVADDDWALVDIDVAGMYPANMVANRLHPEHLGEKFVEVFGELPVERAKYKKGTPQNALFKLGGNGTFGNTNNVHSVFLDPQCTMATTVNGQLAIAMLAEWLLTVDTLQIIQANTDGITYRIHRSRMRHAEIIRDIWMRRTRLVLEEALYSKMWIRDVNNYIAEPIKGGLKQKGAYWYPRNFPDDISYSSPPAWHKDYSAQVVIMAAVAHMVEGVDIERYIYAHRDPFDFMCRAKVDRSCKLMIGDQEVQRITRYYLAVNGGPMVKVAKPKGTPGTFKRKNKLTDQEYHAILRTLPPDTWDERIHSKNKARYPESTSTAIEAGYLVAECNLASKFDFANLNYAAYIDQAKKLVIA
ncbi:hypothetical protein AOQ73_06115 [Bradyrhizobium pachyrhizi]|uniref:hypothetical protein n=1 Tax=Bradyrhizobium pachyrhizi TaxID=280333 RepID=UPI0007051F5D|nr:hypothetical protein [Bradyrhizobium pachyrhizi]KRQ11647.1 hypothetical protein AOQ73_06115 [Bradyrhizobium pachyrhizi]